MNQYLEKFDALTLRERLVVAVLILLIPLYLWYVIFYEPMLLEEKNLTSRTTMISNDNTELKARVIELQARIKQDPNEKNRQQIAALKENLKQTRQEIIQSTSSLIKPEDMPEILRRILVETEGLELTGLNGLGRSNLIEAHEDEQANDNGDINDDVDIITAYKHGLRISFSGNFSDTLSYIQKLEDLSYGFFWSSLNFNVDEYPLSNSEITLFTLSLDEDWIEI